MTKPEQRWRPIALMPAFKYAVSTAAETARIQAENMRLAINQHDLISRVELARMRVVYEDTQLYVQMCEEQLSRWRNESTTTEQIAALDRLDVMVEQWADDTEAVLDAVTALLHQL
jgi:hypothetical protein